MGEGVRVLMGCARAHNLGCERVGTHVDMTCTGWDGHPLGDTERELSGSGEVVGVGGQA